MIPRLWYMTDGPRGTGGRPLVRVIERAVAGGVGGIVLRERELDGAGWRELLAALQPLRRAGARLLVSRRLDLARSLAVDGVHLAADAVPVADARAWLGPDLWIGYSAHAGEEARAAAAAGASYVTLSPIHPTDSKPGAPGRGTAWLAEAVRGLAIPALGLGGVTPERTHGILKSGAHGVAVVSAIGAAPDVRSAARAFGRAIEEITGTCA